jgi:parallel beta-helix repeat protein
MLGGSGINFFGNESNQSLVSGNKISGNLWGITIQGTAKPNFGEIENEFSPGLNQFFDNGNNGEVFDFYNNTPDDILAQNNYWGTMDPEVVESHIFHQPDDPGLGLVDYLPLYDIYTGITEKNNSTPILISGLFPNPANEYLNIQLIEGATSSTIQLLNATGRLVFSSMVSGHLLVIPVADFERGVYFLKVSQGDDYELQKVLIQR